MSRTPIRSINDIFSVLAGTYTTEWSRQLESAPKGDVKAAWMFQLACFSGAMHRIEWALDNLPDKCPNPVQFRNLCRQAPAPFVPQLPGPAADPERVAKAVALLKVPSPAYRATGCEWARQILLKKEQGLPVGRAALSYARQALGMEVAL